MRNIKWALLGGVGVTTVAAGTMGGLYAHEVSKRVDRIADKHFKSILDNINHIREASGLGDLEEDYDGFKDDIIKHVADEDSSLKIEVIDVLEETVTQATDQTKKEIADEHAAYKTLLDAEVDRLAAILKAEMDQIKNGIVGDHDINYYKTLIMDSVGSSQFQDLSNVVTTLDADLDQLKTDVEKNKTTISSINTKIDAIATFDASNALTGGALKDMETNIGKVKTAVTALETATKTQFTHLDSMLDEMKNNLIAADDSIKNDLLNVKTTLANNSTTITRLDGTVAEMQEHIARNTQLIGDNSISIDANKKIIGDLEKEINSLESKYVALKTTTDAHTTEIGNINTSLKALKDENKILNDLLVTKTDNLDNRVDSLTNLYNDLKTDVQDNQKKILDLVLKYNNLETKTTQDLTALKQFFVNEQDQQNIAISFNAKEITRLELLVLTNTTEIDDLKNKINAIKSDVTNIQTEVNSINNTLKKYERKFAEIEIDLADAIQATDDLEVALRGEIDNNKAAILGLDTRIAALENAPGGSSTDMLYKSTRVQPGFGLDLWNRPFYSPQDLTKYRRFEMFGYSYSTGTYFSLDFNVDTTRRVFDFAGGERLHPNRGWWKMKIDYINKKMNFTFFQEAGNASWVWYDQRGRMDIYEIYGIK